MSGERSWSLGRTRGGRRPSGETEPVPIRLSGWIKSMGELDEGTFDREVRRIRRDYGGDRDWKDTARLFGYYLYWKVRESGQDEDSGNPERNLRELIGMSRINKYMWDAVNLIAQEHLARGDPLPRPLADWIERVLVDQCLQSKEEKLCPRPRKGKRTAVRDRVICAAIESLVAQGYPAMRSGGSGMACAEGGTACDIVGKAFNIGYKHTEKILDLATPSTIRRGI